MEWFRTWFDSPYYHILYKNRDEKEAESFLLALLKKFPFSQDSFFLDLACGKGRHSRTLYKMGFRVLGLDLSPASIKEAQQNVSSGLSFDTHDMRLPYCENPTFDAVFNLFSSFGYFEDSKDDQKVLDSVDRQLKKSGILFLDFMNSQKAVDRLVEKETKEVEGITFEISRKIEDAHIIKNIRFQTQEGAFNFSERVKIITLQDFKTMVNNTSMHIEHCFGNYELETFDENISDRLILVIQKP